MQLNRRSIFHWNRWMISVLILVGMGIMGFVIVENRKVKAADWIEENKLADEQDLTETLYCITYHASGGSGEMPISELSDAGGKLASNRFYRTGYTFAGWAVSENGDTMYQDEAFFYPTGDMILYAVWEVNKHAVSLEGVGEEARGDSSTVSYGSIVSIYAGTKEGYTFDGWTIKSGEVVLTDASNDTLSFPMPDADICLYANWVVNSYQIVLEEGGEGNSGSITAPYQSTVTIQSGTKEGYTFDGWLVEAGDVVLLEPSASTTTFVVGTSDIKVKALWKVNHYTVTRTDAKEGSIDCQDVAFGEVVTVNAGTKNGFYFCGWKVTEGIISLENPLEEEIYFTMPASDVVLQATWKEIIEVKADLNDIFHNKYDNANYYKDDCYNIGQNICVEKDMLDVVIGFSDGDSVLAKEKDYKLENCSVDKLGENRIEIVLTAGEVGLSCYVTITGYSSELDTIMKELGLSQGDYSGLAAKVEQIQAKIQKLGTEIAMYEENLMVIKQLLAEVGMDTDLTEELQKRLKNVQDSVQETVNRLRQAEEELNQIKQVVSDILPILGIEDEEWEEYENLSDILKKLQEEVEKTKKNEEVIVEELNRMAEKLGIKDTISSVDDGNRDKFFEKMEEKIDEIKKDFELYQKTMDQLKDTFKIDNTGSLESQLEEVIKKIELKLTYLEDLKNEIERQLEGEYGEVNTEGIQQTEAIFVRIRALKEYANDLKQFYSTLQKLLGLNASSTKEEIYQNIANIKDKVTEYDQFLNQAEALLYPNGANGSNGLVTGAQTKEELNRVYAKIEDIVRELDILKELFQMLSGKEEIPIENKEEWFSFIEQIKKQKEIADRFINNLRELLEMDTQASEQEIYHKVSAMKETMAEYWDYLGKVESFIQMEDKSHVASGTAIVIGPVVTERLTDIYNELTRRIEQQIAMSETIKQMIEKEKISKELIQELQEMQEEMLQQKQQADLFLEELKKLLELQDSAGYKEVIYTITDIKGQLKHAIVVIEKLMQQLGMTPEAGEQGNLSEQLKIVLNKVLELMQQLEEQMKKSEEKEQTIVLLEQKINGLSMERQESEAENKKLKEEIEKLKQDLSLSNQLLHKATSSDSSGTSDEAWLNNLERKNQLQQERIIELEKQLQTQAKEIEGLLEERKELLVELSNRDRQIGEQKEQIELFEKQLVEKEERRKELETKLQAQEPMQNLLEKNQISYEQLVTILSNKNNTESSKTVQEKKETKTIKKEEISENLTTAEEESITEEAIVQKEKREDLKTAIAESEELSLEETEEENDSTKEDGKEDGFHWGILLVVMILLIFIGSVVFALCGKDTIQK